MVAPATEFGAVREIWLAPVGSPGSKKSFLIRDDAYSKTGAVFGRTLRLGDPVDLGPNSTIRQTTWEGGRDQTVWSDKAMFYKGTADGTSKTGKLRLWPGWERIGGVIAPTFNRYTLFRGTSNFFAGDIPLWIGEYDQLGIGATGSTLSKYDPVAGTTTAVKTFTGGTIASMGTCWDSSVSRMSALMVGLSNGVIWTLDNGGVWTSEFTGSPIIDQQSIVNFNGLTYIAINNAIIRRTTGPVTYTTVHNGQGQQFTRGLIVWNNRLWWLGVYAGNRTSLFVSDGATMVEAFRMPDDFHGMGLQVHYGSLYICGFTSSAKTANGIIGQVWRYNGSSLTRLFQSGDAVAGERHYIYEMGTMGKYLAWGRPGVPSQGITPGLMLYDAELDAVMDGPTFEMDPLANEVWTTSVVPYGGLWVVSMYDSRNYGGGVNGPVVALRNRVEDTVRNTFPIGPSLSGKSFEGGTSTKQQYILSSVFDGDLPGEKKTWMTGRIRVKIPQFTSLLVKVLLDEGTTEVQVANIVYDAAQLDYRLVVFPLKDGSGNYLKSTTIQYKLYLQNTDASANSVKNPYVDTVEVNYSPAPTKRRQWQLRVLASNAQEKVNGSPNPLTTTDAIVTELENYWAAQTPLLFWDALADGSTPATTGIETYIQQVNTNSYRVDDANSDINAEVGLTLVEVVTA